MIIDVHTHVYDKRRGMTRNVEGKYLRWGEASGDWLVSSMDLAGVDKAFLISFYPADIACALAGLDPAEYGESLTKEYVLEVIDRYPDRFYWFPGHIDPRKDGYLDEAEEYLDNGATGLKLCTSFCGLYPDDPAYMKLYELCGRKSAPVILDYSYWYINVVESMPLKIPNKNYAEFLRHVHALAEAFPEVNFQIAHYGSWDEPWTLAETGDFKPLEPFIELLIAYSNLFADTGALPFLETEEYPYPGTRRLLEFLIRSAGANNIMYGTDWPYFCNGGILTYRQGVNLIRRDDSLTEEDKEKVLGKNAMRFLGSKA